MKWSKRIAVLATLSSLAGQQVPAPPTFKLIHELTGYYRDGDLTYNVKGDVLRLTQTVCGPTASVATAGPQYFVCPPGMTCGGNTVQPCTEPEITIGNLEQLQRTIHDLELVQKAWEDKRRIEAYVNSKFE